jgi:hypothetical protein
MQPQLKSQPKPQPKPAKKSVPEMVGDTLRKVGGYLSNPMNPRKATSALLVGYNAWVKLVGAFLLLIADVWLTAKVFIHLGVSNGLAWVLGGASSALQIGLFDSASRLIIKGSREAIVPRYWWFGPPVRRRVWVVHEGFRLVSGILVLIVALAISLGDTFVDGSAAFIEILGDLPRSVSALLSVTDIYVWILFTLICLISFAGERSARLLLTDEEEKPSTSSSSPYARPVQSFGEEDFLHEPVGGGGGMRNQPITSFRQPASQQPFRQAPPSQFPTATSRPVTPPVNQPVNEPVYHPVNQPVTAPVVKKYTFEQEEPPMAARENDTWRKPSSGEVRVRRRGRWES